MTRAARSDRSPRRVVRRILAVSIVALLAVGAAVAFLAGAALAFDQVAILDPSPAEIEAEPGEEVTVSVEIAAEGHDGDGVAAVAFVARYHPDYLEVRDLEAGSWLGEGDEETSVRTEETIANPDGTAILEAEREPVGDGATGEGELVTLTVAVDEDAPPGVASIDFEETDVELAGDWPMPVHDRDVTIAIDGGDEPVEPFDHPEPDPDELETDAGQRDDEADDAAADGGETSANGDDGSGDGADAAADGDDPIVDGTAVTTIVAGVVLLLYAAYRRT